MKNDRLTKTRVSSFEIVAVDGDWVDVTGRWHKTADACRGVANLFWQAWVTWHFQHESESTLKRWLDERQVKGVKAAGKCPVDCYPKELGNMIYGLASRRFPELAKGEIVLVLNRLSSGLKSRKASKGSLPGWSAILLHHESHPSFTGSFPILFDRGNTATIFEPPAEMTGNWHVTLRVSRYEADGKGKTHQDRMELWCKGRKVASQVSILRRIARAEYKFLGSQMHYSRGKRKWFLKLCYEMPRADIAANDPSRVARLCAAEDHPWDLVLPTGTRRPGGHGRYIGVVRRQLLMQRWNRRANYHNAGSANKGHGRERAGAGPQWKLRQRWKDLVKRVNSGVVCEVLKACEAAGIGMLIYEQPDGDCRETRFLARDGKVAGREDSSGWDWFQVRTMLEQRSADYGIVVRVEKFEGSGDAEKVVSPRKAVSSNGKASSGKRVGVDGTKPTAKQQRKSEPSKQVSQTADR